MAMTNEQLEAGLLQARDAIIALRQDHNQLRQEFDTVVNVLKNVRDTQNNFVMWDQVELAGIMNILVYNPRPGAREETFGEYIYRRRRRVTDAGQSEDGIF